MAIDFPELLLGRLIYVEPIPALDDVRFERIIRGFSDHYLVTTGSGSWFSFVRGEGYLRAGRFDAFGLVDSGTVERLRADPPLHVAKSGNVLLLPPRYEGLRFELSIRVVLVVWAVALLVGAMAIGGDWPIWVIAYFIASMATILVIQRSLKKKINRWLARESWN